MTSSDLQATADARPTGVGRRDAPTPPRPGGSPSKVEGAGAAPLLRLEFLGAPRWSLAGAGAALKNVDAVLLASLAVRGVQERDPFAQWLWPERDLTMATNNLRQRIKRLRRETGHRLLDAGAALALLDTVSIDLRDDLESLPPDDLLARGEFLAGMSYPGIARLEQWVGRERRLWRRRLAAALTDRSGALDSHGQSAAALTFAERADALDPGFEAAASRLMQLHYRRGNRAAALDAFDRYERVAKGQGTLPGREIVALRETVQRAAVAPDRRTLPGASLVRPPLLVGREAQWLQMERAWAGGRPFLLRGEAGIGKSRLIDEFTQSMPGVVAADGRPGDEASTYFVLTRLLREVLRACPVTPDPYTRHELSRLLIEFGPPPSGSAGQQAALWQAFENLLRAAQQGGLVALVVDNLHFADAASLEALRWLSASRPLAGLRFGFTTRDDAGPALRALLDEWVVDPQRPEVIDLPLLGRGEVERFVESLGLPDVDPVALGTALFAHAGGHPFHSLETLKDMVHFGSAFGSAGLPRPSTAQPLLERRLRSVPEALAGLVRVAAVMGGDLTVRRAAAVLRHGVAETAADFVRLESCHVFNGQGFAHDLLRDCALQQVASGQRAALHEAVAETLAGEDGVPSARLAFHWEAAQRWPQAAVSLQAAADAARLTGRLHEQRALLERAAQCWRRAGDLQAEFDALRAASDTLVVLQGPAAMLGELPRLEALAVTPARELSVLILRAEALAHLSRSEESLAAATEAAQRAERQHPSLLIEALIVRGMALAQCRRHAEAIEVHRRAAACAERLGASAKSLQLTHMEVILLYEAGRIGEAIVAARRSARLTRASGDQVEAAQVEGNLSTLLMIAGDPAGAYDVACGVRRQHEVMGSSTNSITRGMCLVCIGNAAAHMGRFDEAHDALAAAAQVLGEGAGVVPRNIAGVSLANLWLTLGSGARARAALRPLSGNMPVAMQIRWHWAQARIAVLDGEPAGPHLRRMGELEAANATQPQGHAAWLELSRQGDAAAVVASLRRVRHEGRDAGTPGVLRGLMVREIDRLTEIEGREAIAAAAKLAAAVGAGIADGLPAMLYVPEVWLTLARAWQRAGEQDLADRARAEGRDWVLMHSREHLRAELREGFLRGNGVNRELLGC